MLKSNLQPRSLDQNNNDAVVRLQTLNLDVNTFLQTVRPRLQAIFTELEGKCGESLEENKRIADLIQGVARTVQVAFKCPKCGEPARFACAKMGNAINGVFTFAHNSTNHGGTTMVPELNVIDMPQDKRRTKKKA